MPSRTPLLRRTAALLSALSLVLGFGLAVAAPASAAAGWQTYDANGDGTWDTAVRVDDYGVAHEVYAVTFGGGYDTYLRLAPGGLVDYAWFDTNANGTWDTWAEYNSAGYLYAILSDAPNEGDQKWDQLYYAGTGEAWYDQCVLTCWVGVPYGDDVYGMRWNGRSYDPFILGAPTRLGENMLLTLGKLSPLAGSMHCHNYRTSDYCKWFLGTG